MQRVAFVIYRRWAFDIFEAVSLNKSQHSGYEIPLLITTKEHEFLLPENTDDFTVEVVDGNDQAGISEALKKYQIDVAFFYGWSWIVREPVLSDYLCLCLHPSPLPRYRGGTPIQHQLVAGESESAVSVFKMTEGIDDGDIYKQIPFSLAGTLDEILGRMVDLGIVITRDFLQDLVNGTVVFRQQQDLENHPALKRRKPEDGEINLDEAEKLPYESVYNLVRGLMDPYPNAYIYLADGVLYVQGVQFRKKLLSEAVLLKSNISGADIASDKPLVIKVSDGYTLITNSKFESKEAD